MGRLTDESSWCFLSCDVQKQYREDCPTYKHCITRLMYEKLKHYEDLEEQGGLIEVVYGFNQYDHDSAFECSVCEFSDWDTLTADDGKYNYCPKCGAKMVSKAKLEEMEDVK